MQETSKLMGNTWTSAYWAPEKQVELCVENSGLLASDMVQTVSLIDMFFYDGESDEAGWKRRIVFDAWGGYSTYQGGTLPDKNLIGGRDQWVYNSGERIYASKLSEFVHFQFADLSAVAPFRFHTVRSLGHLLYDACHLQNRLRCSFAEAVFENLMLYFRVNSRDDAERALKIELLNRGLIDPSVQFIPPSERWQPNAQMIELGMAQYQRIIEDNSSGYVQNQNFSKDRVEKTRYQVQAEVNAMMTLVSAALQQAYKYQMAEHSEIFRRFMLPNSRDPDVREFRVRCLKRGVPEKMLVPEAWDLEPERVMGSGNKTLEMAIAQQLMEWRAAFGAEAQQTILHDAVLAITDDAAKARQLVPDKEQVSDAAHEGMISFGTLLAGGEVQFKPNTDRLELTETLLGEMGLKVQQLSQLGGAPSMSDVLGLSNVSKHIGQLIALIEQDKPSRERAKKYGDALGKLTNMVKKFAQAAQEQAQKQNGDGGVDAETRAKIAAMLITAKAKAANTRESHAQRTAQRQAQAQLELQRDEQKHALDLKHQMDKARIETAVEDIKASAEIRRGRLKSLSE